MTRVHQSSSMVAQSINIMSKQKAKRKPWPVYDEYEYYDNETSYLGTLLDGGNEETTLADIARALNAKFGNNRSAAACRRKAEQMGFI